MDVAALSCTSLVDQLYPQAQRRSRSLHAELRDGIELVDRVALRWVDRDRHNEIARRILFCRYSLKVFAGDVRKESIRQALAGAECAREKLNAYFTRVAKMLEPRPEDEFPGTKAGAYFDPELWSIGDLCVEEQEDCDLRLAALTSAMLCQEDGVKQGGASVAVVADAIANLRWAGQSHRADSESVAATLNVNGARPWSLTQAFANRRPKRV